MSEIVWPEGFKRYVLEHTHMGPCRVVVRFCGDHLNPARQDEWGMAGAPTVYPSRGDAEEAQRIVGGVVVEWAPAPAPPPFCEVASRRSAERRGYLCHPISEGGDGHDDRCCLGSSVAGEEVRS